MGLFSKKNNEEANDYILLASWLDDVLKNMLPEGIIAFDFCLYEGSEGTYDIQLIGSDEFDENDDDWACTDFFTTGENVCYLQRTKAIKDWEEGLSYIIKLLEHYLERGKYADVLKGVTAVGVGFCDGDINIIYTHP